jgi:hypothetical protein
LSGLVGTPALHHPRALAAHERLHHRHERIIGVHALRTAALEVFAGLVHPAHASIGHRQ